MSFGSELRAEREKRGVELDAISAATKVSERQLRALETDAHGELPGGLFNRGFVRAYCRHLGLDEETWVKRFVDDFERDLEQSQAISYATWRSKMRYRFGDKLLAILERQE